MPRYILAMGTIRTCYVLATIFLRQTVHQTLDHVWRKFCKRPNISPSPNVSGDMIGLTYESAKYKVRNLKNYCNTKSKKLPLFTCFTGICVQVKFQCVYAFVYLSMLVSVSAFVTVCAVTFEVVYTEISFLILM